MSVHVLKRVHFIPATVEEVWAFFSSAENLKRITPAYMNFRITNGDLPKDIYEGQVIKYKVSPVLGIPLAWTTVITAVETNKFFIDEQQKGPYKLWRHQHHFEAADGGTKMTDVLEYEMPFGILGAFAHGLFAKDQVASIFDFRNEAIEKIFPKK